MATEQRTLANSNFDRTAATPSPYMDRFTHSVLVETTKNLKHYLDIKRRERDFIVNPNSTAVNTYPLRARFIYGTGKQYPPLYASVHSDYDVKNYLQSIRQNRNDHFRASSQAERQVCREEVRFHMRTRQNINSASQAFLNLSLAVPKRSHSSSSSRNTFSKAEDTERKYLINDATNFFAEAIKVRKEVANANNNGEYEEPSHCSPKPANPSPCTSDRPDHEVNRDVESSLSSSRPQRPTPTKAKHPEKKKKIKDPYSKIKTAKLITDNILCKYKISIFTGNVNGASTNAKISIILYGKNGRTESLKLTDPETESIPFQKNQKDIFSINAPHVGKLVGIEIGHDEEDSRAGWYLNQVLIEDSIRSKSYKIGCNAWLSSKCDDKKTKRVFLVSKNESEATNDDEASTDRFESEGSYSSKTTERSLSSQRSNESGRNASRKSRQKTEKRKKRRGSVASNKKTEDRRISPNHLSSRNEDNSTFNKEGTKATPSSRTFSPEISRTPSPEDHQPKTIENHRNNHRQQSSLPLNPPANPDRPHQLNTQYSDDFSDDMSPYTGTRRANDDVEPSSPALPRTNKREDADNDVDDFFEN